MQIQDKLSLPEINAEASLLEQELNSVLDGESDLTPEEELVGIDSIYQRWLVNQQELKERANAWCWVIVRLLESASYFRQQAQRFEKLARTMENRANSMKQYLLLTVEANGGKLPTKDFPKLSIRTTQPSVEIDNSYKGDIPDKYLKALDVEDRVSKLSVKEALKDGIVLPFAKLSSKGKTVAGLK